MKIAAARRVRRCLHSGGHQDVSARLRVRLWMQEYCRPVWERRRRNAAAISTTGPVWLRQWANVSLTQTEPKRSSRPDLGYAVTVEVISRGRNIGGCGNAQPLFT